MVNYNKYQVSNYPVFGRNMAYYIFEMFLVFFGCYFVNINYFLIVNVMELLSSNKVLYYGVTVFIFLIQI